MSDIFGSREMRCPQVGLKVNIDRTESECRSRHGCEQEHCPLTKEFDNQLERLMAITGVNFIAQLRQTHAGSSEIDEVVNSRHIGKRR